MKLAAISDIHLDVNQSYPVLGCLAELLRSEHADAVIIAGDITEHAQTSIEAVCRLEEQSGCRVFYVPGNHDMWSENFDEQTTESIYARYVNDPHCLADKPQILEGTKGRFALIGDIGWYDYSFASPDFAAEELEQMSCGGRTWQDRLKNQWTADNRKQSALQLRKLEKQLEAAAGLPVIAVTHMIPVREFCVPEERTMWKYFNAFLGTENLGKLFDRCRAVYSISGHVHYRKEAVHGSTRYICPCLGYHTEWKLFSAEHADDPEWQIRDSIRWIEM